MHPASQVPSRRKPPAWCRTPLQDISEEQLQAWSHLLSPLTRKASASRLSYGYAADAQQEVLFEAAQEMLTRLRFCRKRMATLKLEHRAAMDAAAAHQQAVAELEALHHATASDALALRQQLLVQQQDTARALQQAEGERLVADSRRAHLEAELAQLRDGVAGNAAALDVHRAQLEELTAQLHHARSEHLAARAEADVATDRAARAEAARLNLVAEVQQLRAALADSEVRAGEARRQAELQVAAAQRDADMQVAEARRQVDAAVMEARGAAQSAAAQTAAAAEAAAGQRAAAAEASARQAVAAADASAAQRAAAAEVSAAQRVAAAEAAARQAAAAAEAAAAQTAVAAETAAAAARAEAQQARGEASQLRAAMAAAAAQAAEAGERAAAAEQRNAQLVEALMAAKSQGSKSSQAEQLYDAACDELQRLGQENQQLRDMVQQQGLPLGVSRLLTRPLSPGRTTRARAFSPGRPRSASPGRTPANTLAYDTLASHHTPRAPHNTAAFTHDFNASLPARTPHNTAALDATAPSDRTPPNTQAFDAAGSLRVPPNTLAFDVPLLRTPPHPTLVYDKSLPLHMTPEQQGKKRSVTTGHRAHAAELEQLVRRLQRVAVSRDVLFEYGQEGLGVRETLAGQGTIRIKSPGTLHGEAVSFSLPATALPGVAWVGCPTSAWPQDPEAFEYARVAGGFSPRYLGTEEQPKACGWVPAALVRLLQAFRHAHDLQQPEWASWEPLLLLIDELYRTHKKTKKKAKAASVEPAPPPAQYPAVLQAARIAFLKRQLADLQDALHTR